MRRSVSKPTPGPSERQFVAARRTVLHENGVPLQAVAPAEAAAPAEAIARAGQVVVIGAGRSRLAVEVFAMRPAHMGVSAHVSSDVTAPPVGDGDLVIACGGSGETAGVLQLADSARQADARLVALLAHPEFPLGRAAHRRTPGRGPCPRWLPGRHVRSASANARRVPPGRR